MRPQIIGTFKFRVGACARAAMSLTSCRGPMSSETFQRRALQASVALGALVPVNAGLAGILYGPQMLHDNPIHAADFDSHWRYLSGLLLAIGLGFWTTIPEITRSSSQIRRCPPTSSNVRPIPTSVWSVIFLSPELSALIGGDATGRPRTRV